MDIGSPGTIAAVLAPSLLAILAGARALSRILGRQPRNRGFGIAVAGVTLGTVTLTLNLCALYFVNDLNSARTGGADSASRMADGYVPQDGGGRSEPGVAARPVPGESPASAACSEGRRVRERDPQLAMQYFSDALSDDPTFGPAMLERGKLRAQLNDLHGAIQDFSDFLKYESDNPEGYLCRARANQRNDDPVAALSDWQRYLDLDPAGSCAQEARTEVRSIQEQLDGK